MEYRIHGFRHGDYLAMNVEEYRTCWNEVSYAVGSITEDELVSHLGDILVPDSDVPEQFFISPESLERWKYLKGAKREPRVARNGHEYMYSEGPIAFPDPSDKPSRTILTSEGGSSPSRMRHVVMGDSGRLRRLVPDELDALQMFPSGWTRGMSDSHRAFCMGNALVVGVPHRIGIELDKLQ